MSEPPGLPAAARVRLLAVAREAIAAHLEGRAYQPHDDDPALAVPHGAFVTLRQRSGHALRGCIGYVQAEKALAQTVAEAAVAAASHDPRFPAVTREEMAGLEVEVSALGTALPIRAEEVVVGRHGLIVRHEGRSGLLLPQVPEAYGWDREAFLDHTCLKAGLPRGAWRQPGCELLAFAATVIRED